MKDTAGNDGGPPAVDENCVEKAFDQTEIFPWHKQITIRAIVTSFVLSIVFNVIVCKLNLTTGIIPSLNVAAGLLGYALIKAWTLAIEKCGLLKQPFTRQENTVIQTCIVASSGIAFSSGTASYLLGMTPKIAANSDLGSSFLNMKQLSPGWIMGFLFLVSFVGLFSIVPLRKVMILKYKLTYPSGTATAFLINSFHTPTGAKLAKKQVFTLFKSFVGSFLWACFQWFFTRGDGCGFVNFPTFGMGAFNKRIYFDFSATYIGVGMICPHMVNISVLIGAIFSWGILWPYITTKGGSWYPAGLHASDLHGLRGYQVFLAIAMMLGDGLFQVIYMTIVTVISFLHKRAEQEMQEEDGEEHSASYDEKKRVEHFLKDQIPDWAAVSGYVALAAISAGVVPVIFPQLKWYMIVVIYLFAPILAFCNAYGCGLTDWSLASNYGKVAIVVFSTWVGVEHGGIVAGLAACGVMLSIVSTASDLMSDFKTGYLTLSSPRAMFFSQVAGTAIGCIQTPLVFWFFYKSYPSIGEPQSTYAAPFASMYRGVAQLGAEGFSSLPKNCLELMLTLFLVAIGINLLTLVLKKYETKYRIHRFIPSPMCMAIPFYSGGYFTIDMCVGSLIVMAWVFVNKRKAQQFVPAVASGLICGDSLWSIPAAILSLVNVKAPLCMMFYSASQYDKLVL